MKKLALLICTLFFISPVVVQAACPLNSAAPTTQRSCETPCTKSEKPKCNKCKKTECGCKKEKACDPCKKSKKTDCGCKEKKCAKLDESCCDKGCCDSVIKQESPCWGMSQQELFKCLNLDKCQLEKACCLHQSYLNDTQSLKDKLQCEENRLCNSDCLSKAEQKEIKKCIKDLENEIKDRWSDYEEQFRYILCKDQLKKFNELNRDTNRAYYKMRKNNCEEPCPCGAAAPVKNPCDCGKPNCGCKKDKQCDPCKKEKTCDPCKK